MFANILNHREQTNPTALITRIMDYINCSLPYHLQSDGVGKKRIGQGTITLSIEAKKWGSRTSKLARTPLYELLEMDGFMNQEIMKLKMVI